MSTDLNFKRRWDIYLNGTDGAKHLTYNMLRIWIILLPTCGRFGIAAVEFIAATAAVLAIIVMPFLFWLGPVIAIFTAHRTVSDDEVRARMRANIHKNGNPQ